MAFDDWNDLKFVLAAHRHGTVTGAAQALDVNPTTVARRLRTLQGRAGFSMFEQIRGGIVLTPAGKVVLSAAERMEHTLHAMDRQALREQADVQGVLRVTAPMVYAAAMAPAFAAFAREHPRLKLVVGADDAVRSILRREADIALRYADAPSEHLVGRRLGHSALAAYTAEHITDASHLPWIRWAPGSSAHRPINSWIETHDPGAETVMYVDAFMVQLEAMRAGVGKGLIPCLSGELLPGIHRVSPVAGGAALWLLTHEDLRHVPRVRAMLDYLTAWLLEHREQIEGRAFVQEPPA